MASRPLLHIPLIVLLAASISFAQQTGGGGTGGGRPSTGGSNPTPGVPPLRTIPDLEQQQQAQPVFISGRVVVDNGTPAPRGVVVELECNGTPRPQAYTDSHGSFSFQVGQNSMVMRDASVDDMGQSNMPMATRATVLGDTTPGANRTPIQPRDLMGCELRASLPGYRSESIHLTHDTGLGRFDVGTIVIHSTNPESGSVISVASLKAPDNARKAFEKGTDQEQKKKWEKAEVELQKAVQIYPGYASAWYELANVYRETNRPEDAKKAYQQAVQADPKYVLPYLQLALLAVHDKDWHKVVEMTERVFAISPVDMPAAYFYNAVAHYQLKDDELAEKSARKTIALDVQHRMPQTTLLLAQLLANKHDFAGAAEQLRTYIKLAPGDPEIGKVRSDLAAMERMTSTAVAAPAGEAAQQPH